MENIDENAPFAIGGFLGRNYARVKNYLSAAARSQSLRHAGALTAAQMMLNRLDPNNPNSSSQQMKKRTIDDLTPSSVKIKKGRIEEPDSYKKLQLNHTIVDPYERLTRIDEVVAGIPTLLSKFRIDGAAGLQTLRKGAPIVGRAARSPKGQQLLGGVGIGVADTVVNQIVGGNGRKKKKKTNEDVEVHFSNERSKNEFQQDVENSGLTTTTSTGPRSVSYDDSDRRKHIVSALKRAMKQYQGRVKQNASK
jgi:hypothetical protein